MPSTLLRRRLLPAVVGLTAAATMALPLPAFAAPPAEATPLAASWLADRLSDAGTVVDSFPGADGKPVNFVDYGRSIDAALGLLAAGGHDDVVGRTLASITETSAVQQYTQGAPGDRPDAAYAGATAKLALFVALTGGDITDVGGIDLLAQLQSLITPEGRLADRSTFGSFANVFGHAFALLALDSAARTVPDELVSGLLAVQCADGSFPQDYEPTPPAECTGQVDATGLVLQALAGLNLANSDAAVRAADWLAGQQRADGSFPGEAPVNSTGYAALGLRAVARPTDAAQDYLASQQNSDGGLRRGAGDSTASDLFATAQALPALAGTTFQLSARAVAERPLPCTGAVTALSRTTMTAGEVTALAVRAASGSTVDLYAYSRPSTTFRKVRSGVVGNDGTASFSVFPATNTRLYARQGDCASAGSVVLNVRTNQSLTVVRNATRDFTFSGRVYPGRPEGVVITLFRLTSDGRAVHTARIRTDSRGQWSFRRVFSGTGRFGFVTRSDQDIVNAPGESAVSSVLIH